MSGNRRSCWLIRDVKIALCIVLIPVVLWGLLLCAVHVFFDTPPFPLETLEKVVPGMSSSEVEQMLGTPRDVWSDGSVWEYSKCYAWPVVRIWYDEDGHVIRAEYDT